MCGTQELWKLTTAEQSYALSQAIEQASFLDEIPGDQRQKLRAARTKLKKLRIEARAEEEKAKARESMGPRREYKLSEFNEVEPKYMDLKWRMISMPGGAFKRPPVFYELYALSQQGKVGDNDTEQPMWAEKGGIDFEGRERWDAWNKVKGMDKDEAKLKFVRIYYEFESKGNLYSDTR